MGSTVQHMLLVGGEDGRVAHWFDSHPSLAQRVRRIYGRQMGPLSLERNDAPDPVTASTTPPAPPGVTAPGWTLS
jgi:hypothetical protein